MTPLDDNEVYGEMPDQPTQTPDPIKSMEKTIKVAALSFIALAATSAIGFAILSAVIDDLSERDLQHTKELLIIARQVADLQAR